MITTQTPQVGLCVHLALRVQHVCPTNASCERRVRVPVGKLPMRAPYLVDGLERAPMCTPAPTSTRLRPDMSRRL